MNKSVCIFLSIFAFFIISSCRVSRRAELRSRAYKIEGFAQGTSYQITYYTESAIISSSSINQLFSELDSSLSIYKPYSLINQFNNSANGLIMDDHLFKVVLRSMKIWKESEGVFDISILPIVEAWGFGAKKHSIEPSNTEIARALSCSGSDKIRIEGKQLIKTIPCLKIDVNGIAQGYG
jgi:thiamine biosynthesis lipoprotein